MKKLKYSKILLLKIKTDLENKDKRKITISNCCIKKELNISSSLYAVVDTTKKIYLINNHMSVYSIDSQTSAAYFDNQHLF